jgi:hypothetical protein
VIFVSLCQKRLRKSKTRKTTFLYTKQMPIKPITLKNLIPLALALGALVFAPGAAAAPPEDTCALPVASDDLAELVGAAGVKGYTVVQGETVEEFDVEILGVQDNAWLPGDKIVIARASGDPIDAYGGGIAYGMSGSPIYTADGKLIGALAYGFSWSPNPIMGITPAEQMINTLDESGQPLPKKVTLTDKTKSALKKSERVNTLKRFPTILRTNAPLAGSVGKKFVREAEKRGIRVVSGPGRQTLTNSLQGSVPATPGETLLPGDSISGELSVGRTSLGGVGTTTWVCDDEFLAFGHPFVNDVATRGVVSRANIFTPVVDETNGPFKYGVATDPVGTMTSDNNYSIGGTLGTATETLDVNGSVSDKTTNRSFAGMMTQIPQTPVPEASDYEFWIFPYLAALSVGNEIAKITNRGSYSYGNLQGGWTITGTSKAGPFSFTRDDRFTGYEAPDGWFSLGTAGDALASDLDQILYYSTQNSGEEIQVDQVTPNINLRSGLDYYRVAGPLEWKKGKMKKWSKKSMVRGLKKKQVLRVRLSLRSNTGNVVRRVMKFKAQKRNGSLAIESALRPESRYGPTSLAQLLSNMSKSNNTSLVIKTRGLKRMSGTPARLSFDKAVGELDGFSFEVGIEELFLSTSS